MSQSWGSQEENWSSSAFRSSRTLPSGRESLRNIRFSTEDGESPLKGKTLLEGNKEGL